jgi:hypothetical protein
LKVTIQTAITFSSLGCSKEQQGPGFDPQHHKTNNSNSKKGTTALSVLKSETQSSEWKKQRLNKRIKEV